MNQKHKQPEHHDEERTDGAINRAFWISLGIIVAVASIGTATYLALANLKKDKIEVSNDKSNTAQVRDVEQLELPTLAFADITQEAGIDFQHVNGASGDKLLPETMGGGVAFFDFDNDGDQDLFFVNSNYWPGEKPSEVAEPTMALYENDGSGKFRNVTTETGLDKTFYGMGVAVGDYDNDGWRDLYVSAVGVNHLFKNNQGKFEDVTGVAKVAGGDADWGTSCGWLDYDKDGLLDLFVCNYITWSKTEDLKLGSTIDGVNRAYAPPRAFEGAFPTLFHNEGDGTFVDVSEKSGFHIRDPNQNIPEPKSLGVTFYDFDNDDWTDIMVANDTTRNMIFRNNHDGTFEEVGREFGVAYDRRGEARGAMGIDTARFRDSKTVGIVIGNFANEPVSLFVGQRGSSLFTDEAVASGLGPQTKRELTFGMFFFDCDLDGRLDILTANGHLENEIRVRERNQTYEQSPHLFWNAGLEQQTEFVDVPSSNLGEQFCKPLVGRGASCADIDGDGDQDVVISTTGQRPRLLRNDQGTDNRWVQIKLVAKEKNLDAIGAAIDLTHDGRTQHRIISPTCSYLAQRQLTSTFGVGKAETVDEIIVHWPDGTKQVLKHLQSNQLHIIKQD